MSEQPTPWQLAAEELIGHSYASREWYELARFTLDLSLNDFPPGQYYAAFEALDTLRLTDKPVTQNAIQALTNGKVPLEWLGQIVYLFRDNGTPDRIATNVGILKSRALAYQNVIAMQEGIDALKRAATEDERNQVAGRVITQLSREVGQTLDDPTAGAVAGRLEALLNAEPTPSYTTGISWMDTLTGGMRKKEIWWFVAAYKMRKSTIVRNLALSAVRAGANVTAFDMEGQQNLLGAQLICMMAVEWLLKRGEFDKLDRLGKPVHKLTANYLLSLGNRYKTTLHPLQVQAISDAILQFKRFGNQLRIYDTTPQNGAVGNLDSVQTKLMRDRKLYGLDIAIVDYMQCITNTGRNYFDQVNSVALGLQRFAKTQDCTMIVTAQRNEETIKGGQADDSHSPGVKGGGTAASTADFLFTLEYPLKLDGGDTDENRMGVRCALSRHGEARRKYELTVHPATGLVMSDKVALPEPAKLDLGGTAVERDRDAEAAQ